LRLPGVDRVSGAITTGDNVKRSAFATISLALLLVGAVPSEAFGAPGATGPRQVLVVDDGQECPHPDYATVQDAVAHALPGALVRVCPGVYTGFVQIDKPLTLQGQPDAVAAVDCFDATPSQPGDLDPTTYAILSRPEGRPGNLLTVTSGDVTVTGLVLQGATTVIPEAPQIEDAAVHLESASAGARIRRNLIRLNALGIDLGSDGNAATRVDHNCLRDNRWGMASQRQDFVGGRVDHNTTFRHEVFGYEIGWPLASTRDSVFAENVARADGRGAGGATFQVQNSTNISIVDNDIEPVLAGVRSASGNADLTIAGNRVASGAQFGVFLAASTSPSRNVSITDNTITDIRAGANGFAIGVATGSSNQRAVDDLLIQGNVLNNNVRGISMNANNTGVVVRDNVANSNQYGIYALRGPNAASTYGHVFEQNTLLGNTLADARDDSADATGTLANTWIGTACEKSIPVEICAG
jgi:hypothetical protein